jgi:hypothetical protein
MVSDLSLCMVELHKRCCLLGLSLVFDRIPVSVCFTDEYVVMALCRETRA